MNVLFLEHCHKVMMKPTHVHIHKYADKDNRIWTKISSNLVADAYVWKWTWSDWQKIQPSRNNLYIPVE